MNKNCKNLIIRKEFLSGVNYDYNLILIIYYAFIS